ncbi:unnamed protein product [Chrysoparadoxa australica]
MVHSSTREEDKVVGCIGHMEAKALLKLRDKTEPQLASLDLSLSSRDVWPMEKGIGISEGVGSQPILCATWEELETIVKKARKGQFGCWELYGDGESAPWKVSGMSDSSGLAAVLCSSLATPGPPTMVLGGFTMHRIKGGDQATAMDPGLDSYNKIRAAGGNRITGRVLDTCTGLGYTAIAASKLPGVTEVTTVELDDVSLTMCSHNPWSLDLFESEKISSLQGDCCKVVHSFPSGYFSAVIHDPPARALCKTTDMYGQGFYEELYRVCKPNGTIFHYIGNSESKEAGRLFRGVMDRLGQAGFVGLKRDKDAFGVVGVKC